MTESNLDKKEKIMRDIDSDEDNLCSHDKYYEDCDECCINESDEDDGKCHFTVKENSDYTGCGIRIHEENCSQGGDDYCGDYFIGTDSFKFCPICGKEASFYWQETAYISKQFELEVERKDKEMVEKEAEEKRREAVKKYIREIEKNRREIEKNRREQERMKEETRINEKIVDYINTFGANNFEMLSRAQKERLFEIGE